VQLGAEISQAIATRDEAQTAVDRAEGAIATEQQTVEELSHALFSAEQELRTQQQLLEETEKQRFRLERTMAEKQSRLEVLRQLNEEGEGLAKGSQAVLRGLDNPEVLRPALAGALVSNLNVERDYIAPLEAALGRSVHAVVLEDAGLAAEILRNVASNSLGQAALALPTLSAPATDDHLVDLPQDAIAWAIDKVQAPDTLVSLVGRLLRGVAIVDDLETALRLKRENPVLQFATLAGEFISAAGVVFGGTAPAQTESLLGRKIVISETASEVSRLEHDLRRVVEQQDATKTAVADGQRKVEESRRRHQAAHVSQSSSAAELLLLKHQLRAAEEKLRQLQAERTTLEQQTTIADERIAQLGQELAALTSSVAEQQAQKAAVTEAIAEARLHQEETTESLQSLRLAVATEKQRHENLIGQRQPMAAREAELADLIAARRAEIANYQRRLELQTTESEQAETALLAQGVELTAAEENVAAISRERTARLAAVNSLEAEVRATRDSLNEIHDQRGKSQVRQAQLQLRVDNLLEHVARRYQLDLRAFQADQYAFEKTLRVQLKRRTAPPADLATEPGSARDSGGIAAEPADEVVPSQLDGPQLETLIADLARQLDNMGPVNLDAVQEYDELEERHRFLEAQNNDLTASRKELLDVIAKINATTQKLFAETFAQVRVNFREIFAELFGGGRADLSLVDESNPLECGIDIIAKPPGKQLQSVSLLSGGERTMTAVALLFAIYMVRPSPFCILDEMDAPLDESNINRFIKVLERFVAQSQFIIITHNKRTIAKADVLYGVTMEERGVSKLVGMRLAAEKGSDGTLRVPLRNGSTQRQFDEEHAEERALALSR
ncbi:MAG: hypothetical protein ABR589_06280, partial [Chthoniobacterales bacterium]